MKVVFNEGNLRMKAYETGFCKRVSKFSPLMFLNSLFYDACSDTTKSMNALAINVKKEYKVEITKQGISERFTENAVKYVQAIIGEALLHQITHSINTGWFELFKRVLIKDSTKFDVSGNLAKQLPGFGGSASKAGVCIQYEFDIKAGQVNDLTITAANRPDSRDTKETINKVEKGDLYLRDLGYSVLSCFRAMQQAGAYFISKLNVGVVVYEKKGDKFVEMDFNKLYQMMTGCKTQRLSRQVYIGGKEKLPVRLVIDIMPETETIKRLKNINAYNKKKGHKTSDNYKSRARFNLFITNIEEGILNDDEITKIYKLRWQVELVFKAWKSIFGIDNNEKMKYERLICLLNARLLLILINWEMFVHKRSELYKKTGKLLSINKCFKTLKEGSKELRHILTNNCNKLIAWIIGTFIFRPQYF
ncbi:MAG: IS4 family transposase [Bacteroidales bacterium]|nr:IS4 family transposase [Bacteroidales bacterium]